MLNDKPLNDKYIRLAHGNGGVYMRELIDGVFARYLGNPLLDTAVDACVLSQDLQNPVITTDGFSVQPLEFPGGNIGSLAIHGVVNDLAVAGGIPRFITVTAFIEEGLEVAVLERIVEAMARAAKDAGVFVVAGDTKIVPRGHGGGVYFSMTAVGEQDPSYHDLSMNSIRLGDKLVVSGTVGDHGAAVMLAREDFGLSGTVLSDSASVLPLVQDLPDGVRFMRDPTRGGLATVAHEIVLSTGFELYLEQVRIPFHPAVQTVCDILGYDPLYLACEGRVLAVVAPELADDVVALWQERKMGDAAVIGEVREAGSRVILQTELGGQRVLEELEDDPLPRIC
jgi:hydrogenase expression/formation protein HypE